MSISTFTPRKLPDVPIKWEQLIPSIANTHAVMGRLDEILQMNHVSKNIYSILRLEEAIWSMKSQKHQSAWPSLKEVLIYESTGVCPSKKIKTVEDILLYKKTLETTSVNIKKLPISVSLMCKMHQMIKKKSLAPKCDIGHLRNRQNWIGPIGCPMEDAYFYPPPVSMVRNAMVNLEKYIKFKEVDPFVQLAVIFAQLLIIHPFMDGNGRIGRLLIPLFLSKKKILCKPIFYISRYFQRNRAEYLKKLNSVFLDDDWNGWIHFFLTGLATEGQRNLNQIKKINELYVHLKQQLLVEFNTAIALTAVDFLFSFPYFTMEKWLGHHAALTKNQAQNTLRRMIKIKLVSPILLPKEHRGLYRFESLLNP